MTVGDSRNSLSFANLLTYSTVRIECVLRGKGVSTGTGFFCSLLHKAGYYAPVLVTCRHVVVGAQRGRLHLHLAPAAGQRRAPQTQTIVLEDFQARWLPHPEPAVDLCVMPMAELLVELQQRRGLALHMIDRGLILTPVELDELGAGEEVVVAGYPNGIWDSANNRPIFRKGIAATDPNVAYMGRSEFLVDTPWLPGTSGAPVFLRNRDNDARQAGALPGRARLLGMICTGLGHHITREGTLSEEPLEQQMAGLATIPGTFGVVITARKLLEFEPILEAIAARGQRRWPW